MKSSPQAIFQSYYHATKNDVFGYASFFSANQDEAQELYQEVYVRFYSRIADSGEVSNPLGYLLQMLRNLAAEMGRKYKQSQRASECYLQRKSSHIDKQAEALTQSLQEALEMLPSDESEIITLHFLADLTFEDAATVIGCAKNTAMKRCHSALKHLSENL